MTTYNVGGLMPIRRFKTLREAVEAAQNGDTIVINKDITESIHLDKMVTIEGNNHTFHVKNSTVGIEAVAKVNISDLNFKVESHANALYMEKGGFLNHVTVSLIGPLLEIYPAVICEAGELSIFQGSSMMNLMVQKDASLRMVDSEVKSYYPYDVLTKDMSEMSAVYGSSTFTHCSLSSIYIQDSTINDSTIGGFVDVANSRINNCTLAYHDDDRQISRKEPKMGPLRERSDARYLCRLSGSIDVADYKVGDVSSEWIGFYGDNAQITVKWTKLSEEKIEHRLFDSNVSFDSVNDVNMWHLEKSTASFVKSEVQTNQTVESAMDKLNELIGLDSVKSSIQDLISNVEFSKQGGHNMSMSYHMIFAGNPGTAKTTVARLVAQALFEIGVLPQNKIVEASADTLVKGYVGQTGENVKRILDSALGGVLFIDEAYQLATKDGQSSFNDDVMGPLLRYMEDYRDQLIVIAAGYPKEMQEFVSSNPGLSRRFLWVDFPDYSLEELVRIFELIRTGYGDEYAPDCPSPDAYIASLCNYYLDHPDARGRVTNGGNGGLVRNLYQQVITHRNRRLLDSPNMERWITKEDMDVGYANEFEKAERMLG